MAQPPSLLTTDNGLPFGVQGACDSRFTGVIRAFAGLYPGRKFGGGALSVYIDGRQVVDVWTGWSDRQGKVPWTADTGAMVFSATKGLAATVIHRLVDRGLLSYDAPVAEYWPEFGANGKSEVTVSDVLRHRSGLAHLKGVDKDEVMDHLLMEQKLAAAPLDRQHGKLAGTLGAVMDPADVINPTSTRDAALARVLAYRQRVRARPLLIRATLAVVGGGLFVVSLPMIVLLPELGIPALLVAFRLLAVEAQWAVRAYAWTDWRGRASYAR